ncbi:hypothetical protein yc1106_04218 [Curvularia clavata]|uniref:Uncharacterized protein n=1 Tax=Curvularia clavata TaxID=95742 RepID=A0A9Q9DSN6_CURCL|nr:hypothetical protein yc1106_04218 [Curvularia clavata]
MAPNIDVSTCALIVTLKSPFVGKTTTQVSELTGIPPRTINAIYGRACERGYEPNARIVKLRLEYLEDAPRSGRTREQEVVQEEVLQRSSQSRRVVYHCVESTQGSRIQQDQADEEAWVDEEDETG